MILTIRTLGIAHGQYCMLTINGADSSINDGWIWTVRRPWWRRYKAGNYVS